MMSKKTFDSYLRGSGIIRQIEEAQFFTTLRELLTRYPWIPDSPETSLAFIDRVDDLLQRTSGVDDFMTQALLDLREDFEDLPTHKVIHSLDRDVRREALRIKKPDGIIIELLPESVTIKMPRVEGNLLLKVKEYMIFGALELFDYNREKASRYLGITSRTMRNTIKKL